MKRTKRKPLSSEEREQAWAFKVSGQGQPCAVCGYLWEWPDMHHVVSQQELKDRGLPLWDVRNALPLCPIGMLLAGSQCHERHENASKRITFRKLRPENIAYAYEVLGDYADDYLKRRYPLTEETG